MPKSAALPMMLGSGCTAPSDTNTAVNRIAVAVSARPDQTASAETMPTATRMRTALTAIANQSWWTSIATSRRGGRPIRSARSPSRTLPSVTIM